MHLDARKLTFEGGAVEGSECESPEIICNFPIAIGVEAVWGVGVFSKVEMFEVGLCIALLLGAV